MHFYSKKAKIAKKGPSRDQAKSQIAKLSLQKII